MTSIAIVKPEDICKAEVLFWGPQKAKGRSSRTLKPGIRRHQEEQVRKKDEKTEKYSTNGRAR